MYIYIYIYVCPKTQKLENGTRYRAEICTKHSMADFQINYRILNSPFSLDLKLWTLEAGKRRQKRPQIRPLQGPIHAHLKRNLPRPPIFKSYWDTPSHIYSPPFDFILFLDCYTFMPTTFSTFPYAYFHTNFNFGSFIILSFYNQFFNALLGIETDSFLPLRKHCNFSIYYINDLNLSPLSYKKLFHYLDSKCISALVLLICVRVLKQ